MGFWDTVEEEKRKGNAPSNTRTGETVGKFFSSIPGAVAEGLYKPIEVLGEGLANAGAEFTGVNKQVSDSQSQAHQQTADILSSLNERLKNPDLSDDEKKRIKDGIKKISTMDDGIDKSTQEFFDTAKEKTDPAHVVNNAAQLALNIISGGTASSVARGAQATEKAVETASDVAEGLKIASRSDKALQAVKDTAGAAKDTVLNSKLAQGTKAAMEAVTNPTSAGRGAAAFGTVGATQGGLVASDQPDASTSDVAAGVLTGGVLGAAGGGLAGFLNRIAKPTATATAEVVNGEKASAKTPDLRPFDQPQQTAVTTPVTNNIAQTATPTPQLSMDELGASASRPVGSSPADFLREQQSKSMAAEVTPGRTESMEVALSQEQLKQLTDAIQGMSQKEAIKTLKGLGADADTINNITRVTKKPMQVADEGGAAKAAAQIADEAPLETKLTKGIEDTAAGTIPEEIKQAFSDLGDSTNTLTGAYKSAKGKLQEVNDTLASNWDNVTNNMSRRLGKVGSDFADKMQTGARTKAKLIDSTADVVDSTKNFTVEKLGVKEAKDQVDRVRKAIEDGDTSVLKDSDMPAYDAAKKIFDTFKTQMEKQGRATRDAYFTHAKLQSDEENTGQIIEAMFNKGKSDMGSSFSKERKGDTAGDVPDIHTLLRKYQQGMANDLAYKDAQDYLTQNIDKIPTHLATDSKNMAEAKQYITDLYSHARMGTSENAASRIPKAGLDTFTDNVLRFNIGNSLKNFTDQIRTSSLLSPEAKQIRVSDDIAKEFNKDGQNFVYGHSTKEEVGQGEAVRSKLGQAIESISPNTRTEKIQVSRNAKKRLARGICSIGGI